MKLRRFSLLSSSLILVLASILSMSFGGQAHASGTSLYWCSNQSSDFNAGADSNFSTSELVYSSLS